jgi:hypothetical protein
MLSRIVIMCLFMIMFVCMLVFMYLAVVVGDAGMGTRVVGPRRGFMGRVFVRIAAHGRAFGRIGYLHRGIIGAAAGVTHGRLPPLP